MNECRSAELAVNLRCQRQWIRATPRHRLSPSRDQTLTDPVVDARCPAAPPHPGCQASAVLPRPDADRQSEHPRSGRGCGRGFSRSATEFAVIWPGSALRGCWGSCSRSSLSSQASVGCGPADGTLGLRELLGAAGGSDGTDAGAVGRASRTPGSAVPCCLASAVLPQRRRDRRPSRRPLRVLL